jgi:hypothetical protein
MGLESGDANVIRVFGNYATLDTGAGSVKQQFVYASDTNQIGVHLTDDSMEWFDPGRLLVHLAGAETITGKKTHEAASSYKDGVKVLLGTPETSYLYYDGGKVVMKDATGEMVLDGKQGIALQYNAVTQATLNATGLGLANNKKLKMGANGELYTDGTDVFLKEITGLVRVDGITGVDIEQGAFKVLSCASSGVKLGTAVPLDLKTNNGVFMPRRVSQNAEPTPGTDELYIWRDADDNKVYLIFKDPDEGVKKVELT